MKIVSLILFIMFLGPPLLYSEPNNVTNNDLPNPNGGLILEFGANVGWGAPYGLANLELGFMPLQNLNINTGAGISMAGIKYGLGSQFYFLPKKTFSPYLGANISWNSGVNKLNVNVENDSAVYKISPGTSATLRLGARLAVLKANFYGNLGYTLPLAGGKAKYKSGSLNNNVKTFAKLMEPKGLEISLGIKFRLLKH